VSSSSRGCSSGVIPVDVTRHSHRSFFTGEAEERAHFRAHRGQLVLAIADDGSGIADDAAGTGLSIVRALVRDELRGTLDLQSNGGLRAEVVFPA